jgi:glycosyltransferase involved in cell wall biosynthesis
MVTSEILFWTSFVFIFYAYFGYPLTLTILSFIRNHPIEKGDMVPTVSFIITAYNEGKTIARKIENTLRLDYPKNKLEVIVASDSSSDRTDEIVMSYQSQGVILVRSPERKGKENAQRYAITISSGEVLVFSDVATILQADGLMNISRNFNDPTVGCVSSIDKFIDKDGKISGEGAYVRYEMFLRNLETKVNSLVGLSGSFFAAKREVCQHWATDLQSDFNTLINSVKLGFRGVLDSNSIGYYENIKDDKKEFERKVRTVLRGITVLMKSLPMLNPLKYGLFSWQLFSHKLCRWLVPFAMLLLLISNILLIFYQSNHLRTYTYFFSIQILFYAIAITGSLNKTFSSNIFVRLPAFFVAVNISIFIAWLKYLKGIRAVSWEPSKR